MIDKNELSVMVMAQRAADRGTKIAELEAKITKYQTALRRIRSLDKKNVSKHAQIIAEQALAVTEYDRGGAA